MDLKVGLTVDESPTTPAAHDGLPAEHAPDPCVVVQLQDEERLLAYRSQAVVTSVTDDRRSGEPTAGPLCLTDRRLVHLDGEDASIDLGEIQELPLAGDRLLVTLSGLHGLIIDIESAPEFRTAIASAISALRSR